MAKLKTMVGREVISGFKGVIDFYVHDGIACARRWPRSPGRRRAPAVMEQWSAFSESTRLWNELSEEVRRTYEEMATDTGLSARDMFTRSYLSGYKKLIATVDELE